MFTVSSLEASIRGLYRDAVHEDNYSDEAVEAMLNKLDFPSLAQALRNDARFVYAYYTQGDKPRALNYRGRDLFGQRATLIQEDEERHVEGSVDGRHTYELWLLEDGNFMCVACVKMGFQTAKKDGYLTEYRETLGYPWQTELNMDLEGLTRKLSDMCVPVLKGEVPVYELSGSS